MATANDIVTIAKQQINISGRPNKFTRWFGSIDGSYSYAWCAVFIAWCADQCGIPGEIIPRAASVSEFLHNAKVSGRFKVKGSYIPKAGDIMIQKSDGASHVGIVLAASKDSFQTIEGNHSNKVAYATRYYNSKLTGFFTPAYDGAESEINGYSAITVDEGLYDWSDVVTAEQLRAVFGGALTGLENIILKYAIAYQVNPALMAAVAMHETGNGTSAAANDGRYNIFGYMNPKDPSKLMVFVSYEECVKKAISNLSRNYINAGLRTVASIRQKYAPPGASNDARNLNQYWVNGVSDYYKKITGKDVVGANFGMGVGSDDAAIANLTKIHGGESNAVSIKYNYIAQREPTDIQYRLKNLPVHEVVNDFDIYVDEIRITDAIGDLNWENSIDGLATTISFSIAKTDAKYTNIYVPVTGSVVRMYTNDEIFRGVVIIVDDGSPNNNKYTAVDLGWYLGKSEETYQFDDITVTDAIYKIAEDLILPIDTVPELNVTITRIYFDKTISDILRDLVSVCGRDYMFDFTPLGLRIYKIGEIYAYPEMQVSKNLPRVFAPNYRGGVSHNISLEEMKNSIKIVVENDGFYQEIMRLQNEDLIRTYGFLQRIIKIDLEKEDANTVANSELWWQGKNKETFSFTILEALDSYTRAGAVIDLDGRRFVIDSTNHSITNGIHKTKLELRAIL